MKKLLVSAAFAATCVAGTAQAQSICPAGTVPATTTGSTANTVGSAVGSAVGGTAGQILGAIGSTVLGGRAGTTTCVPWNQRQRPDAYGYYDENGVWHVGAPRPNPPAGYYDRNGRWVQGYPAGYYDARGNWVAAQGDPAQAGYYDANGYWIPSTAYGYYGANGQAVPPTLPGYWSNGRWVAGPVVGSYDARGRFISGTPAWTRDASGRWVPQAQPGYYDASGRWIAGTVWGYYDANGRWVTTQPGYANMSGAAGTTYATRGQCRSALMSMRNAARANYSGNAAQFNASFTQSCRTMTLNGRTVFTIR